MGTVGAVSVPQQSAPSLEAEQGDSYSSTAWKLALLLGVPAKAQVALVGNVPAAWRASFHSEGFQVEECARAPELAGAGDAACVIWCPEAEDTADGAAHVASALSDSGCALLLRRNRFAPFYGRRSLALFRDHRARLWWREKRALVNGGLQVSSVWLPWPTFEFPEEFISLDSPAEFSASAGVNRGAWGRLRSWGHDGYAMIAAPARSTRQPLGERITSVVAEAHGSEEAPTVSRFDMRDRGALVMMLNEPSGPARVARVARAGAVAAHVSANDEKLRRLRSAAAHRPDVLEKLPEPSTRYARNDCVVWVEKRLPGTVSWRLPTNARPRLDEEWSQFLGGLCHVGRVRQVLDRGEVISVLQTFAGTVLPEPVKGSLAGAIDSVTQHLATDLGGQMCTFSWSHGDFGYGNLLADPSSGALVGVIDWETGSAREFCGTDWMNMLIVRESSAGGGLFSDGVGRLIEKLTQADSGGDPAVARFQTFVDELYGNSMWLMPLLRIAVLRAIQRQARYPSLFQSHVSDYAAALELVCNAVVKAVPVSGLMARRA